MMRSPLPAGARVWAYSRDSGGDDQDVGDQNRYITTYCETHDLVLERLFCDEASPGSSTAGREQFEEMMALARSLPQNRLPDGLILWSFARFARDFDDAQFYKASLRRRGLSIISLADDVPANGPHARLIESIVDWKNDQFLKDLSKNVQRGLRDIALQGYAPGGFPPVGYESEDVQIGVKRNGEPRIVSQWVPDPEMADRVRRAWEMRAQGATYKEIHQETKVLGSINSYSDFFRNKTYLGIRQCGDLEVEDAHEALIDRATWDAVQNTLYDRPACGNRWPQGKRHPRRKNSDYLLSGLARCIYCGSAMSGSRSNINRRPNPWRYYLCGKKKRKGWDACKGSKVGADPIEDAVMGAVISRVLTPDFAEQLVGAVNDYLATDTHDLDKRIEATKEVIAEKQAAIANLLDLAERFGAETAAQRLLERESEKKTLERELESLQARRRQSQLRISEDVLIDLIATARDDLKTAEVRARRKLLSCFVDKVEIGTETGRLWYTFPLDDMILDLTGLYFVPPRESLIKTPQMIPLTW